jgi:hypothetical protein
MRRDFNEGNQVKKKRAENRAFSALKASPPPDSHFDFPCDPGD